LRGWLKDHADRAVVEVVASGDKDSDKAAKNAGPAFSLCRYKPGTTRSKANVDAVSGFVADLDNVNDDDMADVFARLDGVAFFAWTTWGSGWAKLPQAWRLVVPLAVDVDADDWPGVWRLLSGHFAPKNDEATKDASRMHLLPRTPRAVPDGHGGHRVSDPVRWREQDGALFDPTPIVDEARQRAAAALAEAAKAEADRVARLALAPRSSANRPDRVTRAETWARTTDPALEGQAGSAVAMRVVGSMVRGFDLDEHEALQALSRWNARCVPPWSPDELSHKVRDALATPDPQGRASGWLLDESRPLPLPTATGHRQASAIDVGENAANDDDEAVNDDAKTWRAEMATARADLEHAMGSSTSAHDTPCGFVAFDDLMRSESPPLPWLVRGVVTEGAVFTIAGEPKAAKTWLALEMAVAVASGDTFVGEFQTGAPRAAFLFLTEDGVDSVKSRLRGTVRGHRLDMGAGLPVHVKTRGALDIGSIDALAWFVASVRRSGVAPGLVVIDPLRNVLGTLKENDNDDMAKVNAALRAVRDVLGCAVGYVHHTAKASESSAGRRAGQRMRGGGALHGGYDAGIHLSAPTMTTDGAVAVFTATVEVEVKAGKSAAPFAATLRVHDDDDGHCVRADWEHKRDEAGQRRDAEDEAAVLAVFDRPGAKDVYGKTELRDLVGGKTSRATHAIDRLIKGGRLLARSEGRTIMVSRTKAA
jgi:hypothetical protein